MWLLALPAAEIMKLHNFMVLFRSSSILLRPLLSSSDLLCPAQICLVHFRLSLFCSDLLSPAQSSLDKSAPLFALPLSPVPAQVRCGQLSMTGAVGFIAARGRRVLHDDQADGRLAGRCRCVVRGILLGGVFAAAVVQDARDEEDQQQDDVAGHQNDEIQGDWINLQVELHEPHDGA